MGIYGGNIASGEGESGDRMVVAASVGAMQHFLGERPFRRLLYPNGLPWVFVFDGLPLPTPPFGAPSLKGGKAGTPSLREGVARSAGGRRDGTVVIVGDIGRSSAQQCAVSHRAHARATGT
jgi:hypothetical protein